VNAESASYTRGGTQEGPGPMRRVSVILEGLWLLIVSSFPAGSSGDLRVGDLLVLQNIQ
jgi:hypothetical protein